VEWLLRGFLTLLISSTLFGGEHYGYVRSGKKAIPGATVTASLDQRKLVTTTDESGMYFFDLPGGVNGSFKPRCSAFPRPRGTDPDGGHRFWISTWNYRLRALPKPRPRRPRPDSRRWM